MLETAGYVMPTADLALANETTPPGNSLWTLQKVRENGDISPLLKWINASRSKAPDKKLLLSSECLMQPEWPTLFQEIAAHTDIQLIYYVRRQDELLLSAWRQWGLKRGLSLDNFLARRLKSQQPNFLEIVNAWIEKTAIKNPHVRFIQAPFLTGKGVIEDFSTLLGLETENLVQVDNQNISVDARLALFLNKHADLFSSVHDEEIFTLLRAQGTTEPEVRLQFNTSQFDRIQEVFEPLNQALLKAHQPEHEGTPVIDGQSARLGDIGETSNHAQQLAFITERLNAATNPRHPKLLQLQQILEQDYGVDNA